MTCVLWPSPGLHVTFYAAVEEALKLQVSLVIASKTVVHLPDRILHKENKSTLRIIGCVDDSEESRPLLISSGHSMFQVGGRGATLVVENLFLRHICFREHHKDIGGVFFALHKSKVEVINCNLESEYGFGVWAVQQAAVKLSNCKVSSASRSGCVSFGRSSLSMERCTVHDCSIHGVCSRGTTVINLKSCDIISSGTRGVYAYHNVTLHMSDTSITNTQSAEHAAVDLWGCSLESSCRDVDSRSGITDSGSTDTLITDTGTATVATANYDAVHALNQKQNVIAKYSLRNDKMAATLSSEARITQTNQPILTCSSFLNYSCTFSEVKKAANSLNITLVRCNISGNKGLGLRTRQCKSYGHGSQIIGSIVNCDLQNNDCGNVLEIIDSDDHQINSDFVDKAAEVEKCDMRSAGDSPAHQHPLNIQSRNLANKSIIWEFERDDHDPSAEFIPYSSVSRSLKGTWQAYDTAISLFIQKKYDIFLDRTNKSCSNASCHFKEKGAGARMDDELHNWCDGIGQKKNDNDNEGSDDEELQLTCSDIVLPVPYERYQIDFILMQQTNTETYYMRSIRQRNCSPRLE